MLILICATVLAAASALPTQQILAPAAALTAIPAANHILILTPQAQVQLEPSLKYSQPIVQHLAPIARIDSPTDQTVVFYPNDNLINHAYQKSEIKPKQLESANITNIVNQFVSAGQTAQAQLEAFQQQLTQGLETLIQPSGEQKLEGEKDSNLEAPLESASGANKPIETARHEGGRYYSVPSVPQFYSNFEVIHTPVNPLFTVHPYNALRARSVALPEEKLAENAPLLPLGKADETQIQSERIDTPLAPLGKPDEIQLQNERIDTQPEKLSENARSVPFAKAGLTELQSDKIDTPLVALGKADETQLQSERIETEAGANENAKARNIEAVKVPEEQSHSESLHSHSQSVKKEHEVEKSHFGKYLRALENGGSLEIPTESKKTEEGPADESRKNEDEKDSGKLISFAEALPSGLAISGEGGLSQAKPIGSAIVGKDGVAISAPSGTAIAGSSDDKEN